MQSGKSEPWILMKKITVLLAEDHTIVREAIRTMIELEDDLEVVGEAQDGSQAIRLATKIRPAVILMDIEMPELNGLEATREILKQLPATKILMLSAHSDDAYVKNAIDSGAVGFLLKQACGHDVCQAIRDVQNGKTFFSPSIARRFDHLHPYLLDHHKQFTEKIALLTPREKLVLQLIAEGDSNKVIAAKLGISIKTVEKHRAHLAQKLDIHETAGLTRFAINAGVIDAQCPAAYAGVPGVFRTTLATKTASHSRTQTTTRHHFKPLQERPRYSFVPDKTRDLATP